MLNYGYVSGKGAFIYQSMVESQVGPQISKLPVSILLFKSLESSPRGGHKAATQIY